MSVTLMDAADERRVRPVEPSSEWILGCDLGQTIDPTALALVERRVERTGEWEMIAGTKASREVSRIRFVLRGARRLPLRTPYPTVVSLLAERMRTAPMNGSGELVIDQTGARAAGDMIRAAGLDPIAVTLSASEHDNSHPGREFTVSKANMIGLLLAKLESRELEIARDLQDFDAVEKEMASMRKKVSAIGHASYNAIAGAHDDLPIAIALALWWACRKRYQRGMFKLKGF